MIVEIQESARKDLKKIDKHQALKILKQIKKPLPTNEIQNR